MSFLSLWLLLCVVGTRFHQLHDTSVYLPTDAVIPSSGLLTPLPPVTLVPSCTRRKFDFSHGGSYSTLLALLLISGVESNPGPPTTGPHVSSTATRLSNLQTTSRGVRPVINGGLLNVRSVVNKAALVLDTISSEHLDFLVLTETWLRQDDPPAIKSDFVPEGFSAINYFRNARNKVRGGGITLIYRTSLR